MTKFENIVIAQLNTLPSGCTQALDGINCELVLGGYTPRFLRYRLDRMVRKGLICRGRDMRSEFTSYDGTPTYGIAST